MTKYAVLGQSFGHRGKEGPGLSNEKLIEAVRKKRFLSGMAEVALQHEMAACLTPEERVRCLRFTVRGHRERGKYLDTNEVFSQEFDWAYKNGITDVYILTHPFIHRAMCMRLARKLGWQYGISVYKIPTGWIPFDKKSYQWWTRGPIRVIIYCIRFVLFGHRGGAVNEMDES